MSGGGEVRLINCIVLHCSDSDVPAHDNIETIRKWHVEERGFSDIGYHFVITKDGVVHPGRPEELIGAHCKGHNANSIGICLTGRHQFAAKQFLALNSLCQDICERHELHKTDILAHCQLDQKKSCPNFGYAELISAWDWH
jgi:N-acetylmuramoyl-L-alanine amidase